MKTNVFRVLICFVPFLTKRAHGGRRVDDIYIRTERDVRLSSVMIGNSVRSKICFRSPFGCLLSFIIALNYIA